MSDGSLCVSEFQHNLCRLLRRARIISPMTRMPIRLFVMGNRIESNRLLSRHSQTVGANQPGSREGTNDINTPDRLVRVPMRLLRSALGEVVFAVPKRHAISIRGRMRCDAYAIAIGMALDGRCKMPMRSLEGYDIHMPCRQMYGFAL